MPTIHGMDDASKVCVSRRAFLKASALVPLALAFPARSAEAGPERINLKVPFHYQRHALSCEMAALRMAAQYHGVVKGEEELLRMMGHDPRQPRLEDGLLVWSDANHLFPGAVTGWQLYRGGMQQHPRRARRGEWGYGVHAPGVAEVAARLGLGAEVFDEVEHVYGALGRGSIPIVIVPGAGSASAIKWHWFTSRGDAVEVINAEHCVAVKGYDARRVWVNDPVRGVAVYDRNQFQQAFALLRSGVAIGPLARRYWYRRLPEY